MIKFGTAVAAVLCATAIAAPRLAVAATRPADIDTLVNSYTTGAQAAHDVIRQSDDSFIVVWTSVGQIGSGSDVFARRYDHNGIAPTPQFQVNTYTTGEQFDPHIEHGASGNFLVTFRYIEPGGNLSNQGVRSRGFLADGTPLGPDVDIGNGQLRRYPCPSMAALADGNFAVTFCRNFELFTRTLDDTATPVSSEFLVDDTPDAVTGYPEISAVSGDEFVVVWPGGAASAGAEETLRARRMTSSGLRVRRTLLG